MRYALCATLIAATLTSSTSTIAQVSLGPDNHYVGFLPDALLVMF
jgi:hypothetical protein